MIMDIIMLILGFNAIGVIILLLLLLLVVGGAGSRKRGY
jgi:hypothetical protein